MTTTKHNIIITRQHPWDIEKPTATASFALTLTHPPPKQENCTEIWQLTISAAILPKPTAMLEWFEFHRHHCYLMNETMKITDSHNKVPHFHGF
jgi:hypothetical protein